MTFFFQFRKVVLEMLEMRKPNKIQLAVVVELRDFAESFWVSGASKEIRWL